MDDFDILTEFQCDEFSFDEDNLYEPMLVCDILTVTPFLQTFDICFQLEVPNSSKDGAGAAPIMPILDGVDSMISSDNEN